MLNKLFFTAQGVLYQQKQNVHIISYKKNVNRCTNGCASATSIIKTAQVGI